MDRIVKLRDRPALMSILGWLLFPGMYLIADILTALGISEETSFIVASPVGIIGLICWVLSFYASLVQLVNNQFSVASVFGIVSSFIPLVFISFVLASMLQLAVWHQQ